ncbi:MAG: class II aldolase/adducin family protein [Clostridia bacterium]|mgnify:CR=1 FL=1|jgi:L-fuculose-phosphate aldolase|nr:class II aldolase/adducin family protein [Clostridia bacterium]
MDIREEIIYLGKKMVREGLVASTWGNISGRVGPNQIYITPSGMEYESLEIEDITLLDLNGNVLEGKRKPSSEFQLHCEIYKAREDVQGIVHTHSKYASAFAVVRKPLPPLIEDMAQVVGGEVSVAQYALPGTKKLATNGVQALGNKGAVLLANHGVVGVGYNLQEAYKACLLVEKTAHIGVVASSLGVPFSLSAEDVQWMRQAYLTTYGQK